jgi:quercetin dioxygenase-like cupin family protein
VVLVCAAIGLLAGGLLNAQDPLKSGTVLQRTGLSGAEGWDAILVLREVPPGAESGRHTQSGNEIVYIMEGSVVLEVEGKPAMTVNAGEAFTTSMGEVHNVKNGSDSAPVKALAFYIAKEGAAMEDLSVPAE